MGIEITEKTKETRVTQTSMLNTHRSLYFGLNGYSTHAPCLMHGTTYTSVLIG